jgi:molybdopterin molybdotransferase
MPSQSNSTSYIPPLFEPPGGQPHGVSTVAGKFTIIDDCFLTDRPSMTHGEALGIFRQRIAAMTAAEAVALQDLGGRILAEPVMAGLPVPAHTNSAVDGYAFAAASYNGASGTSFPVAGRAAAGHAFAGHLGADTAVRIFTGAVIPPGFDTVAMQEDCTVEDSNVCVPRGLKPGANVRKAGEDVASGSSLFAAGHIVRPQDLAALASIGRSEVSCFRRLRVAIVSSGDEIVRPAIGRALQAGHVFDANGPMLGGLAALAGAEIHDLGIWPDDADVVTRNLSDAAAKYDLILTSGGASKGEEDHMAAAIDRLGTRHLWQLAIKPGRPIMFGQIGGAKIGAGNRQTVIVGLPGNPVAVFVCFLMYVFPMIRALGGAPWREPRRFQLPAAFAFKGRKPGRREFWRGMLVEGPDGQLSADKFARDGSGLISGLRVADGLIDIPEDHGDVAVGDLVSFIPFTEFGIV